MTVRGFLSLASFAASWCVSAPVSAQVAPPPVPSSPAPAAPEAPPPPSLAPPKLVKDEGAQYPDQALKDGVRDAVSVILILEIDPSGAVRKASVETPVGHGFDEAALAAAEKLQFEPATRDGKPVAARIKHRYDFPPPASRLTGRVASAGSDAPIANASVVVRAADGTERTTQTAADGSWSLDGLPPGTYRVRVEAARFAPEEVEQELGAGEEVSNVLRLSIVRAAPPPAPVESAKPPVDEDDLEEVTVKGRRPPREVTRRTLEQREMTRIPGTSGDALRALQNMPGVARPPGLAGLLIVRGAAPGDTNIFVDGALVPIVYHFGGLSSVIPTEMLEKIDFFPGNFSAQYGRAMGGIVDVNVRDPKKDKRLHGMAQVDLIDARFLVEGPIGKTGWNFAVSGRRSYVDVWLKPVLEGLGSGVTTAPVYYDYQAVVSRDIGKNQSFRLMFFGSDDRLDLLVKSVAGSEPSVGGSIGAHTGFWRGHARYRNKMGPGTELRVMAAAGRDFVEFNIGDVAFKLDSFPITSRVELAQKLAQGVTMNVGMDMLYTPYTAFVRAPPFPRPGEPPGGPLLSRPPLETTDTDALYRPALYTEFELVPWRGGRIVPGVRMDYAKDTRAWDVGPRVVARQDLTREFPRTTLKGGLGIYHQPPTPQQVNPVFGMTGLTSNRAYHYSTGVEQELSRQVEVSVEGFYKQLDRLITQNYGNVGRGRAFGLETLLRYKPDARFFGWLAYTLSRSERQDRPEEAVYLAQFDQTHILTVLGSYRLGRGWEVGSRFRLVSGNMYTPNNYGFFDANAGVSLPQAAFPPFGERLPLFHQLDIRVDKTWKFKDWQFSVYADVWNAYNHGNVEGISYNYNYTRRSYATGLPFLPSLGMRGEF